MTTGLGFAEKLPESGEVRLSFHRVLPHPTAHVWHTIATPPGLRKWLGEADFEPRENSPFVLRWLNADDVVLTGVIVSYQPQEKLQVNGDAHGTLLWTLATDDCNTRLHFSNTLTLEPQYYARTLAGWHWHLDTLERALGGHAMDWNNWDQPYGGLEEWHTIHEKYVPLYNPAGLTHI
jgi:uncharacterized protein YndB with AHSA1/START domain